MGTIKGIVALIGGGRFAQADQGIAAEFLEGQGTVGQSGQVFAADQDILKIHQRIGL